MRTGRDNNEALTEQLRAMREEKLIVNQLAKLFGRSVTKHLQESKAGKQVPKQRIQKLMKALNSRTGEKPSYRWLHLKEL